MKAIQFDSTKNRIDLKQLDVPKITRDNEILIKVAYAGVCGTDLHIIQGEFPCKKGPVTLGHEFSGTVMNIGKNVTNVKIGDNVVVDPNSGCGTCSNCHIGNPHFCEVGSLQNTIGIYRNGGWAEFCLVPDDQVFKLPNSIPLERAALCEPISCLSHGLDKISPIHVGAEILIQGAGIIGNLWAATLHLIGHRNVTVSEPNSHRRNQLALLETGFEITTPEILSKNNKKFDVVVDCSGNATAISKAIGILNSGGKLCVFGVAPPHEKISVSPYEIFAKELTIVGVKINPFTFPKALGFLDSLGDRYLSYEKLGIKKFKLEQYKEAIDELKEGKIAKAAFQI